MSNPAVAGLKDFFTQIWGDNEGYAYLPVKEEGGRVRKFFVQWPDKADQAVRHVLKYAATEGCEIFYSPALYSRMSAKREYVLGSNVAWVDFDGNFPEEWPEGIAPRPSVEVQSSVPERRHAYWLLDGFKDPKVIEKLNRSLAYALNADLSGWDANQFLRPPYSTNRKYKKPITAKVVADRQELAPYTEKAFKDVPTPAEAIKASINFESLPTIEEVKTLAKWDKELLGLFNTSETDAKKSGWDRSGALARIAYKGAELSWSDEQILVALVDADDRWKKYVGRQKRMTILEELVNRARAKVGYDVVSDKAVLSHLMRDDSPEPDELPDFMTVGEINDIPGRDDWFIEGLLTHQGLGLFTGRPGTGKTQLSLQCAADLATGRDHFLDYKLSGKPVKVLFLSLEMSAYQLQHFTTPLAEVYKDENLNKNLTVYGRGEPVYFTEEAGQHLVDSWLDDHKPDVVIVDSLSQSATDISSDDEMKELFSFLKSLRRHHKFGLIFIHHHRKKANDAASRKQANSQSDIYGSYQIAASIDFALDLEDRNDENGYLDLHLLKARFVATGEPAKVHRDEKLHFTVVEDFTKLATATVDTEGGLSIGF